MMYPEVRLRRLRQSQRMRDLVCETRVSSSTCWISSTKSSRHRLCLLNSHSCISPTIP